MIQSFAHDVDLAVARPPELSEGLALEVASHRALPLVLDAFERELHRHFGSEVVVAIRNLQFDCMLPTDQRSLESEAHGIGEDLAKAIAANMVLVTADREFPQSDWLLFPTLGGFLGSALAFFSAGPAQLEAWPFAEFLDIEAVESRIAASSDEVTREAHAWCQAYERTVVQGSNDVGPSPPYARRQEPSAATTVHPMLIPSESSTPPKAEDVLSGQHFVAAKQSGDEIPQGAEATSVLEPKNFTDLHSAATMALPRPNGKIATVEPPEIQALPSAPRGHVLRPRIQHPMHHDSGERGRQEADSTAPVDLASGRSTGMAGLVFLLRPILELDIAEHLWAAGLIEAEFLATVALHMTNSGSTRDRASRLLFGPSLEGVALDDWARNEVHQKTLLSFEQRFTLEPDLRSSFEQPFEESLVTGIASVLQAVLNLRLGREPRAPLTLLSIAGTIHETPRSIVVTMEAEHVDLDVKFAGIDVNPGFIPWLNKSVSIAYRGLELF